MGMEMDSSSFPSSSSSSAARWKYDVFLSFRGEDTRYTLADLLYDAFNQKGINAFKEDEKLEKGKTISPELSRAIEKSRFAVVIFSKNYASSTWCLDELAKIFHCKEHMGMKILPVFYDVEPSDVRKQMGTFAQAFIEHENRFKENIEKVNMWRAALTHVGNLAGWPLMNRPFSEVIKSIVRLIWHNLNIDAFSEVTKGLVGIDSHVVEMKSRLAVGLDDVRFIGIWGMGGMGKTTLAWVVYHKISKDFEACSFIEDVRENFEKNGFVPIQQKIIEQILMEKDLKIKDKYDGVKKIKNALHHKKILLVLDDVDKLDMLDMLAGERDWFGPGSRIVITTRYMQVLKKHGVCEIYEVKGLNDKNAFQLFCFKAFKKEHVPNDYIRLSNHILEYARGLPLALEVLGSFLFEKSTDEWKSALERLKEHPNPEVLHVLQISFDGLHDNEQKIFLHIACFFNHNKKDYVVEVLDNLGLYPGIGLKELVDKSLLKIMDDDVVWMHHLLEEMGKNIVFRECPDDPGERSRLWVYEDIDKVFRQNRGTKAVQAMDIWGGYFLEEQRATWNPDAFLKMYKLKFLRVNDINYVPTHLPDDLKILDWNRYPSESLPSSFQPNELVQLRLQCSKIEQLWTGIKHFQKLKSIDLSHSSNLIITPDFTGVQNLEALVLYHCEELCELHPSIGFLKKLVHLDLMNCKKLICLPSTICSLKSLANLILFGCSNFDNLPENLGNVKSLKFLDLSATAIKELPSSFERLASLTSLKISGCENLVCLPNTTCGFKFHGALDLSECLSFKNLPANPWIIEGLEKLDLSRTAIEGLPSSIEHLTNLTLLTLRHCVNLVRLPSTICCLKLLNTLDLFGCLKFDNLPENIGNMEGLEVLNLCWTAIKEVPSSIVLLKNLIQLGIRGWKLSEFFSQPESPEWLTSFFLPTGPTTERILLPSYIYSSLQTSPAPVGLSLPSLSSLQSLTHLLLSHCDLSSIPNDIGCLSSLRYLDLSGNNFVSLSESMSQLSNLRSLYLEGCKRLQSLENVPSTIDSITADNCMSLERLPKLLYNRFRLDCADMQFLFVNCFKLVDNSMIQGVNNILQVLNVMLCIFQGRSGILPKKLQIIIPGSEIPKYFNHECTGHELKVQVPSKWSIPPIRIAFCVVFVPNNWLECPCNWELSFIIDGFAMYREEISGSMKKYDTIESHHLWLTYFSYLSGGHPLTIRASSCNLKVEKIGVRFIYLQDTEIPSKTMAQCINNSSIVVHHDIDDSIVEGSRNKRSCDEDDGVGPSGECCSIVEPPPKRIQKLGGFMEDFEDPSQREFSNFFAMDAEDQTFKKLEAIHECSSFQDIKDINQILAQNSNNNSTLYLGLDEIYRDIERFSC